MSAKRKRKKRGQDSLDGFLLSGACLSIIGMALVAVHEIDAPEPATHGQRIVRQAKPARVAEAQPVVLWKRSVKLDKCGMDDWGCTFGNDYYQRMASNGR